MDILILLQYVRLSPSHLEGGLAVQLCDVNSLTQRSSAVGVEGVLGVLIVRRDMPLKVLETSLRTFF